MALHGSIGVPPSGAVVHPVVDGVDGPAGAFTFVGEVVDVGLRQHAFAEVAVDGAGFEASVLSEGAGAEVLRCHWISFLSFPSDTSKNNL